MKAMDKIIGYSSIKRELKQISDTLKNREAYDKLGVSSPRGLLLYGDPGVGKSLMAAAIIEESGRQAYICRKDKPNGDFVKYIKETFDKAAENAPSIVFLDDMDKFTNGDERHPDAEEYVTVQIESQDKYLDHSYHGFDEQLLWRYEDLKGRYMELLDMDAPVSGDDYFTTDDYRYAPIHYFETIRDVWHAMEIAKEDLATKCDIIVCEDGTIENKDNEEEDPNQITVYEIVLLPTWFQTAVAA